MQLIKYNHCITELGILFKKAYRLQDAGVLFVKNVKEQVSAIYKGFVLKAGSKEEVANFTERILQKANKGKKLKGVLDDLVKTLKETDDYSSIFAKVVSSTEDNVTKLITDFEEKILKKKITYEDGLLVNSARKIKQPHIGPKFPDYINWEFIPDSYFKGSKITHFHPNGSGLSLADIQAFVTCELLEIRAFGPSGNVFSMKNLGIPEKALKDLNEMIKMQQMLGEHLSEASAFRQLWRTLKPM